MACEFLPRVESADLLSAGIDRNVPVFSFKAKQQSAELDILERLAGERPRAMMLRQQFGPSLILSQELGVMALNAVPKMCRLRANLATPAYLIL